MNERVQEDSDYSDELSEEDVADAYEDVDAYDPQDPANWQNTADTTRMWELINANHVGELREWIEEDQDVAHIRSEDGRGPLWWAHEYGRTEIIDLLLKAGVRADL